MSGPYDNDDNDDRLPGRDTDPPPAVDPRGERPRPRLIRVSDPPEAGSEAEDDSPLLPDSHPASVRNSHSGSPEDSHSVADEDSHSSAAEDDRDSQFPPDRDSQFPPEDLSPARPRVRSIPPGLSEIPPPLGETPSDAPPVTRGQRVRPLLVVERLSKVFPIRQGLFGDPQFLHAVEDVSFYLRRSETLGIVGESGSGKSTLARAVLRLTEPTFGRVLFDDRDITRMSQADLRPIRRRMQIIFQDPSAALNPRMTVREIVGEGLSIFRMAKDDAEATALVEKALSLTGLPPETMPRFPHELSGGQKQRVGIARALAVKPELLVCDEPLSALDVSVQAQIMNLLLRLQRDLGLSMLFISHDLRAVAHTSHRVAVMFLGKIVEMGPTATVCERRYHPYTRALFDAVPRLTRSTDSRARLPIVTDLAADTPSAIDPPKGCVYAPRCPHAEKGKCDVEVPVLTEVVPGSHHRVACWHPEV
ncbi:MAG: ATP-binding cassette domain-containing protein [Polyangiaceae bacterium]